MSNDALHLDGTDLEIIELLEADGRRTIADIAKHVSLSAPAVKRRISRLEQRAVITGYTALIDHAKLGQPIEAFTELRFSGSTRVDDISTVGADLPEVRAVFTMAGDPDALVWMRVSDVDHLKRVVDHLRRDHKVTGTKTLMVLGAWTRRSRNERAKLDPRSERS